MKLEGRKTKSDYSRASKFQFQLEEQYPDRFVSIVMRRKAGQKQETVHEKVDSEGMTTLAPAENSRSKRKDVETDR